MIPITPKRSKEPLISESTINKYSPFLIEARRRIIFTVCLFIVVVVFGFIYSNRVISLLIRIFGVPGINIVFTSPFQFINLSISISLLLGLAILFPLILLQIILFLKPALKKNEFHLMFYLLPFSILLFISGFVFGVMIMRYIVLASYNQSVFLKLGNYLDIGNLLSEMLTTATIMGVTFQFPVVITALMKLKIIKHEALAKGRVWVYAIAALFAGIVPPADIPSTVVYFLVIIALFEVTLVLNKLIT